MATVATKKKTVTGKTANAKAPKKSTKKAKLPPIREQFIVRPSTEQLHLLKKAIFHSYKMLFTEDNTAASTLTYNGITVCPNSIAGQRFDLTVLFEKIVNVYGTL